MAIGARQARSWATLTQSYSASMVQKLAPRDAARSAEGIETSDRNGRRIQLRSSLVACGAAWNATTTGGDRDQAVETGATGRGVSWSSPPAMGGASWRPPRSVPTRVAEQPVAASPGETASSPARG